MTSFVSWILGYYGKLSSTSSLDESELWAFTHRGLTIYYIILEKGIQHVKESHFTNTSFLVAPFQQLFGRPR